LLKGSTQIVDRGFTFQTVSFRHEKLPYWYFSRCAVTGNDSSPAVVILINVKKLTSLKVVVRTMWWYHSTKTAKIFLGNPRWGHARGVHKLPHA